MIERESCKIGCKVESYALQRLSKNYMWCKQWKFQASKAQILVMNPMQKVHPNWNSSHHRFDDVSRFILFLIVDSQ